MRIGLICFNNTAFSVITDQFLGLAISCSEVDEHNEYYTIVSNQLATNTDSRHIKNIVKLPYSKTSVFKLFKTAWQIYKVLKNNNIDRVFVFGENPLHAIVCLLFNGISVATILDPKDHSGYNRFNNVLYFISRLILILKCRRILLACPCLHEMLIENFKKLFGKDFIKKKLGHLDYGNFYNIEDMSICLKNGIEKEYDLCYFGRIEKYKGVDFLIDVLKEWENQNNRILKLLIISKNFEFEHTNKNITIINDYLSTEELLNKIASSRFVVMPYLDATGTYTVHLANIVGVPVIASDSGCFPYFIQNEINGLIFKSGDKNALLETLTKMNTFQFNPSEIRNYNIKRHTLKITTPNFVQTIIDC